MVIASGERNRLAERIEAAYASHGLYYHWAVMALVELERPDRAFSLLRSPQVQADMHSFGSGFLFLPVSRPLRTDPRFWWLAAELGLATYWVKTGNWPDMCGQDIRMADCRSLAKQALDGLTNEPKGANR